METTIYIFPRFWPFLKMGRIVMILLARMKVFYLKK